MRTLTSTPSAQDPPWSARAWRWRHRARSRALEHGEELVGPRLDGLAGERHRGVPKQGPHVTDQLLVPLAQPIDEAG